MATKRVRVDDAESQNGAFSDYIESMKTLDTTQCLELVSKLYDLITDKANRNEAEKLFTQFAKQRDLLVGSWEFKKLSYDEDGLCGGTFEITKKFSGEYIGTAEFDEDGMSSSENKVTGVKNNNGTYTLTDEESGDVFTLCPVEGDPNRFTGTLSAGRQEVTFLLVRQGHVTDADEKTDEEEENDEEEDE
jgi:hypothetical protein